MNTIFVHRDGQTEPVTSIDRSWLSPAAGAGGVYVWVDLAAPSIPESLVLTDSFRFHRLAVEEARESRHSPKIDAYDDYLFAALAGPDADVSVFVGAHYLVSVHWKESKAVADLADSVRHGGQQFDEGPFAMFHRLVEAMTIGLGASVDILASHAERAEQRLFEKALSADLLREGLQLRREAFVLAQRLDRQAAAIGRLAAREVVAVSEEMAYRFRDVRNRLARQIDGARAVEHRMAGLVMAAAALPSGRRWF